MQSYNQLTGDLPVSGLPSLAVLDAAENKGIDTDFQSFVGLQVSATLRCAASLCLCALRMRVAVLRCCAEISTSR